MAITIRIKETNDSFMIYDADDDDDDGCGCGCGGEKNQCRKKGLNPWNSLSFASQSKLLCFSLLFVLFITSKRSDNDGYFGLYCFVFSSHSSFLSIGVCRIRLLNKVVSRSLWFCFLFLLISFYLFWTFHFPIWEYHQLWIIFLDWLSVLRRKSKKVKEFGDFQRGKFR